MTPVVVLSPGGCESSSFTSARPSFAACAGGNVMGCEGGSMAATANSALRRSERRNKLYLAARAFCPFELERTGKMPVPLERRGIIWSAGRAAAVRRCGERNELRLFYELLPALPASRFYSDPAE